MRAIYIVLVICSSVILGVLFILYFGGRRINEYYNDGTLKLSYIIKRGEISGIYNEFYENGRQKILAKFINGVQVDTMKAFYDNGILKELSYFKEGRKDGPFKEFYPSGKLRTSGFARSGYKDSLFSFYSPSERLDSTILFQNGRVVSRVFIGKSNTNYLLDYRYNYSIEFPEDWKYNLIDEHAILILINTKEKEHNQYTESINLSYYLHPIELSLKEFVASFTISMQSDIKNFQISSTNIDETKAEIKYSATYNDRQLKALVTVFYYNDRAYLFTCTADEDIYDKYELNFKEIVNTFNTLKGEPNRKQFKI